VVFSGKNRSKTPGAVSFDFVKEERRVGVYYFYIADADFGAGFIKVCTYFPYPAKVWLNGHEWPSVRPVAKRSPSRSWPTASPHASNRSSSGDLRQVRTLRRPGVLRPLDVRDSAPAHR